MKLDVAANELLGEKDVFADVWNAAVFEGRQVIDREELRDERETMPYRDRKGKRSKRICDCRKYIRNPVLGKGYLILENQAKICNTMPVRKMEYVCLSYREQIRTYQDRNIAEGRKAYAAEIFEDQKLLPVLMAVLYWGEEPWERPCSIRDILEAGEDDVENADGQNLSVEPEIFHAMPGTLREMADDIRLQVIPIAHLPQKVRESLKSDLRLVADYMAYRHDWERFCECVRKSTQPLKHMGKVLDVLEAVSSDGRFRKIRKLFEEEYLGTEEEACMCEMLDRIEAIGREDGLRQGREDGLRKGRKEGRREGHRDGVLSSIRNLMKNMSWSAEQAMNAIGVPKNDREFYLKRL